MCRWWNHHHSCRPSWQLRRFRFWAVFHAGGIPPCFCIYGRLRKTSLCSWVLIVNHGDCSKGDIVLQTEQRDVLRRDIDDDEIFTKINIFYHCCVISYYNCQWGGETDVRRTTRLNRSRCDEVPKPTESTPRTCD